MIVGRTVNYRLLRNPVAAHRDRTAWTPAALFAQGQQGVWYEPKPEYLYQDAEGTTPVTADGDPVGYMQDLSGNGNHATQSTSAARPIYRTDGVLHWLQPDGVDDMLAYTTLSGRSVAFQTNNHNAIGAVFGNSTSGVNYTATGSTEGRVRTNSTAVLAAPDGAPADYAAVFVISQDASLRFYCDGEQSDDVLESIALLETSDLFVRSTFFSSPLFYGGVVSDEAWSTEQIASVSAYMASLRGTTL